MKQQCVVNHIILQNEIPTSLDRWVTITPCAKILCLQKKLLFFLHAYNHIMLKFVPVEGKCVPVEGKSSFYLSLVNLYIDAI
jgi:hypothetical protein